MTPDAETLAKVLYEAFTMAKDRDTWLVMAEAALRAEAARKVIAQALAAERAAALERAAQVAVWEWAATTNGADDHRWVVSADLDADALDTPAVIWCQWCGVHRVEVPDWTWRPQCPAIANIRALIPAPEPRS